MMSLIDAPKEKRLKILSIEGGHGVRRKLLSMGFHKSDIIELDSRSIFRGPLLIKNLASDTSIALGRGIAKKITVEVLDD